MNRRHQVDTRRPGSQEPGVPLQPATKDAQWSPLAEPVLITGGAGFVGGNLARRLLTAGQDIIVFDNLSRSGVADNLRWLREVYGNRLVVEIGDVRDYAAVQRVVAKAGAVFHFAAQVAVTSSLSQPREDFMVNAQGTLNLLEALRTRPNHSPLLFTSTNKVYGNMANMQLREERLAYTPTDAALCENGIAETAPLDFHSPYGCSKGCAEQYVLEYSHSFGLPAVVFRMSCIYGPLQCGNEDQGWVAHFASSMYRHQAITVYGNGKQVRDLLFVDDLIDAMLLALRHIDQTSGRAFNIGGGPVNARSVLEIISLLSEIQAIAPVISFADWRIADQRYYVSDTTAFRQATDWEPKTCLRDGIEHLCAWLEPRANGMAPAAGTVALAR